MSGPRCGVRDFGSVDYPKSIHPHEAPPPARRNAQISVKPESESILKAWKKLKEEDRRKALASLVADSEVAELLVKIQSELAEEGQEVADEDDQDEDDQ